MTAPDAQANANLIAALVSARAAIDAVLVVMSEPAPAPLEPQSPAAAPAPTIDCEHKNRTDLRTFGVAEHWVCDDCGHEEYRR